MTITLRPITKANWRQLYQLSETLSEEQNHFVAHNGYSMLEAIWDADENSARAIYTDETLVGFLMTGLDQATGRYWIVRLMIGAEHQGKGYGRATLEVLIDEFRAMPNCDAVYIGFNPDNRVAQRLYESVGFRDTGKTEYEEMIFRLPLTQDQGR